MGVTLGTVCLLYGGVPDRRYWRFAFIVLLVVECVPFWAFRYFPSQDGPSHLHNALVLANYGRELIYRQYYARTPFPFAGNVVTQLLLIWLIKVMPPLVAEKLLLSLYVVLLFVSFRYVLGPLTRYADHFSVFAALLAPNFHFYMGFWNFCFSVPLLLLLVGYYLRQEGRWRPATLATLTAGGVLLYLTHAVSWVLSVVAVAILGLPQVISSFLHQEDRRGSSARGVALQYMLPICSLLPSAILLLTHLEKSQETCTFRYSLKASLWQLYSLQFFETIVIWKHLLFEKAIFVTLVLGFLCVLTTVVNARLYNVRSTGILILSLTYAAVAVLGPNCVGSGSFIHERVGLYACCFFVVWLASALVRWPRIPLNVVAALFCCLALILFVASIPALSDWNDRLAAIVRVGQYIRPRTTVLMLNLQRPDGPVNPYQHAVDLLSTKSVVDILNYEAMTDTFLTRFQSSRSPIPALGTLKQLNAIPPVFDVGRYSRETQGCVDYMLFVGEFGTGRILESFVNRVYRNNITGYSVVSVPQGATVNLGLYQRNSACSQNADGGR